MKKKINNKRILAVIFTVFIFIFCLYRLFTYYPAVLAINSEERAFKENVITDILGNIKNGGSGKLELSSGDINNILTSNFEGLSGSFGGSKGNGNYIHGVEYLGCKVFLENGKAETLAHLKFHSVDFYPMVLGNIKLQQGKLKYTIEDFSIGKLKFPRSIILNLIKKEAPKDVEVAKDSLSFDLSRLPIYLSSISVKENMVLISYEPLRENINPLSYENYQNTPYSNSKIIGKSSSKGSLGNTSASKKVINKPAAASKASSSTTASSSIEIASIKKIYSGLDQSKKGLDNESINLITKMQEVLLALSKDSTKDFTKDEIAISNEYGVLTESQKSKFKSNIMENVDMVSLQILYNMFIR